MFLLISYIVSILISDKGDGEELSKSLSLSLNNQLHKNEGFLAHSYCYQTILFSSRK